MSDERDHIRQRLSEELAPIAFSGQEEVLRKAALADRRSRLSAFWNKELVLPLQPLGLCILAIVIAAAAWKLNEAPIGDEGGVRQPDTGRPAERQLIEAGGNLYWKDLYERAVKRHEH